MNGLVNFILGLILNIFLRPSYSVTTMRRNFDFLMGISIKSLQKKYGVKVESVDFGGASGEIIHPRAAVKKTFLYLHGGGYFMGSLRTCRRDAALFANKCGARVGIIDYRLAPEHPFPAALEDAEAAYKLLLKKFSNDPVFICGDSAGGGLALALGLLIKDQKLPAPAGIFCISPSADLTGSGKSFEVNAKKDVWLSRKHLAAWKPWYAGTQDNKLPYMSPVFGDFSGFSPLLLLVGDQEVLLDDSVRVAEKAKQAGVDVSLHLGEGMQHNWLLGLPFLSESKRAWKEIVTFSEKV